MYVSFVLFVSVSTTINVRRAAALSSVQREKSTVKDLAFCFIYVSFDLFATALASYTLVYSISCVYPHNLCTYSIIAMNRECVCPRSSFKSFQESERDHGSRKIVVRE